MAALQAMEFKKGFKKGKGTQVIYDLVRKYVKPLEEDRELYIDINACFDTIKSDKVLEALEKEEIILE